MKSLLLLSSLLLVIGLSRPAKCEDFWQPVNTPTGGRINNLMIHNSAIWAATQSNGVFRSQDAGMTWEHISSGLTPKIIRCLAACSHDTILAATNDGAYMSTDNGSSWFQSSTGLNIDVYWLTRSYDGITYAASAGWGFATSTDNGVSWVQGDSTLFKKTFYTISCGNNGYLVAGGLKTSVLVSSNKGATWFKGSGLPDSVNISSSLIDMGQTFYVGTWEGIYKSTDLGLTWTKKMQGMDSTKVTSIYLDNTGYLYAATSSMGVYYSLNNGESWLPYKDFAPGFGVNAIVSDLSGTFYAGANDSRGVLKATMQSSGWSESNDGLKAINLRNISFTSTGRLIATTDSYGYYTSDDRGYSWTKPENNLEGKSCSWINIMGSGKFLALTDISGILQSNDNGANWEEKNQGLQNHKVNDLAISPKGWYIAGTGRGVFISKDEGSNWEVPDTTVGKAVINSIVCSGADDVYAGGGSGIFKSTDGGLTWALANNGFISYGKNVRVLRAAKNGSIFAGTQGYGIYRSTDQGASWERQANGLYASYIYCLIIASNGDILTAGGDSYGVFRSNDNGDSWYGLPEGITSKSTTFLGCDSSSTLYAVTGSGFFRSNRSVYVDDLRENSGISLKVIPNPLNETGTVEYSCNDCTCFTLALYDLMGNKLGTILDWNNRKDNGKFTIDTNGLPPGVYLLLLDSPGRDISVPLIIER